MTAQPPDRLLEPPADLMEDPTDWATVAPNDPVVHHLASHHWTTHQAPTDWQVARSSQAVYLYRETATGATAVAKFFTAKTGGDAQRHAGRELEALRRVRAQGLETGQERVVEPLSVWRGVLFLEHVPGLTLEDRIAVRRSQPGTIRPSLAAVGRLLAALHSGSEQPGTPPDVSGSRSHALKVIDNLGRYGVLQDEPLTQKCLKAQIERWVSSEVLAAYIPTLVHGDATTTNFIFPPADGGVVAIDLERSHAGDPAVDLGRILAEISHSIGEHGGTAREAMPLTEHLIASYLDRLPASWDSAALRHRAIFYQADSTLRIARNGWLSRLTRTALVARALALLSLDPPLVQAPQTSALDRRGQQALPQEG